MARAKKKRNKKYRGADAANSRPNVIRVQAVSRNKLSQWLHDNRPKLKAVGVVAVILLIIVVVVSGVISLF